MGTPVSEEDLKGATPVAAVDLEGAVPSHGSKYPQPRSMSADDQSLGLESGPMERTAFFPAPNDPQGGAPGVPFQRQTGSESHRLDEMSVEDAKRVLMANIGGQVAGSAATAGIGEFLSPIAGRMAGDAAAADRMAASAAMQRANATAPIAKSGMSELLPLAIKTLLLSGHGHMLSTAMKVLPRAITPLAAISATGVGAGAGAAGANALQESPTQAAARVLLGMKQPEMPQQ